MTDAGIAKPRDGDVQEILAKPSTLIGEDQSHAAGPLLGSRQYLPASVLGRYFGGRPRRLGGDGDAVGVDGWSPSLRRGFGERPGVNVCCSSSNCARWSYQVWIRTSRDPSTKTDFTTPEFKISYPLLRPTCAIWQNSGKGTVSREFCTAIFCLRLSTGAASPTWKIAV